METRTAQKHKNNILAQPDTFQSPDVEVPTVKNKKDMKNFSANKEDMPPQVPYKDPKTGWDKDFATSD